MTYQAGTKKIRIDYLAAILTVFFLPLLFPYHARADNDGSVWTWGWNNCGQLGIGSDSHCASDYTRRSTPQPVSLNDVVAVDAGQLHTVVLRSNGTVWGWGRNLGGTLGLGTTSNNPTNTPVQAHNISGAIAVAAGTDFSIALTSDGTVWGWGSNTEGTIAQPTSGQNMVPYKTLPIRIGNLSNIVAIGANGFSAAALRSDGTVWSWGLGSKGQLGNGTSVPNSYTPVMAQNLANVVAIAVGYNHKVALKSDGTVWAWGDRFISGTPSDSNVPVLIGGISDVVSIVSGRFHVIAKKSDGTAWSWGQDSHGVLGNTVWNNKNTPTEIVAVQGAIAFAAGHEHSIALKPDGTVWSWGLNAFGQLGDGTDIDMMTAVMASGLSGVTTIGAGVAHTIAVKGRASHSATMIDATHINVPAVNVLGNPMNARLEMVIPGDGSVLVRVSGLGYAFPNPNAAIVRIMPGNAMLLHVPSLIIDSASFWVNLEYVPTNDGQIWFKLVSFGQN